MTTDLAPRLSQDQLSAYLNRIGYVGQTAADVSTLDTVIWRHQLAIPFENLDIVHFQRPISLDPGAIFSKLVSGHRGGFCFEQNGLLALALRALGFTVTLGYGTWQPDGAAPIPPFDHIVLQVFVPGDPNPRLADVGFGQFAPSRSVPLAPGVTSPHPETGISYLVATADDPNRAWRIMKRSQEGDWSHLYDLDLTPRQLDDYEARSRYHQTSDESIFRSGILCTKPVDSGRVSITKETLVVAIGDERTETALSDPGTLATALAQWFGVQLER